MTTSIKEIEQRRLPLDKLLPMPNNRQFGSGMSPKAIQELANSIVEHGIRQPLLVRPHPDPVRKAAGFYQIIAGCRRQVAAVKAAEKTKVEDAPCVVIECDDSIALELRAIENLQREGLNELEEAAEFQALLDLRDPAGKPIHTWDSLAKKLGKSPIYVRARVKLLAMPELAKKAFLCGKLNSSIALMLARIPDPEQAHKATVEVLDRAAGREENALDKDAEPMSYRAAKDHIGNKYMKRLKGQPFDQEDEYLVPIVWRVQRGNDEITISSITPPGLPTVPGRAHVASAVEDDGEGHKKTLWSVWDGLPGDDLGSDATIKKPRQLLDGISKSLAEVYCTLLTDPSHDLIVIERAAGGKCSDCPFRTGMMKALFPDVESADVCTHLVCLKNKVAACQKQETQKFAEQGQTLLKPKQAEQVLSSDGESLSDEGRQKFIPLNEKVPGKRMTYGELLEKENIVHEVVVARAGNKTVALAPISEPLVAAINKAGVEFEPPEPTANSPEGQARQQAEREARGRVAEAAWEEYHAALGKACRLAKYSDQVRTLLGVALLQNSEHPLTAKEVRKLDDRELFALIFERQIIPRAFNYQFQPFPEAIKFAAGFGVDFKAIIKSVEKKLAATEDAPPDAPKDAKPEKKK